MHIAIVGAGAWGSALSVALSTQHKVSLYARDAHDAARLVSDRENRRYLPGVAIPQDVVCSADLEAILSGAELVVLATPVSGLRHACTALAEFGAGESRKATPLVWLCKGFEEETFALPHQIVAATLPNAAAAVLSGPSFALEVARGMPCALTVAAEGDAIAALVVEAFHSQSLRVYRSRDVIGVEVGGAVKNVLAIATGISDGLGLGLNARAALITRGLTEMMRVGVALGGQAQTLMGLTGVGDLILTCTGALSRNRKVGEGLGRGQSLAAILAELGHVAEGVRCARAVQALATRHAIEVPIIDAVCAVMFEDVAPRDAVSRLLSRAPRDEL